jgi:hypothetical protein
MVNPQFAQRILLSVQHRLTTLSGINIEMLKHISAVFSTVLSIVIIIISMAFIITMLVSPNRLTDNAYPSIQLHHRCGVYTDASMGC